MSGFTKLVPEIIQSSMWNESSDVRIVWITMLAIKDENGYVQGDARTLARFANVPVDKVEEALTIFLAEDPSSRTPDNNGRRIAPMAGGYIVLNHHVYRAKDDVKREQIRERVRKHREKLRSNADVTQCNVTDALPSASVSVSVSASFKEGGCKGETKTSYGEFKNVKLKPSEHEKLVDIHGETDVVIGITILDAYIASTGKKYMSHYATMNSTSWVWDRVKQEKEKKNGRSSDVGIDRELGVTVLAPDLMAESG